MRIQLLVLISVLSYTCSAKEWKNLRVYKKETGKEYLESSDWLRKDRKQNTLIWQQANTYNLKYFKSQDYNSIAQRRDFYLWIIKELENKGHEVVWPKMAHYVSSKLRLTKAFPYRIFINKAVKTNAKLGSETVFNEAFKILNTIFFSDTILKAESALQWDKNILKKEQYVWIESIYLKMESKPLRTIGRMAKGKGFYNLAVPKQIKFKGKISSAEHRYNYAINTLREYCKERYL